MERGTDIRHKHLDTCNAIVRQLFYLVKHSVRHFGYQRMQGKINACLTLCPRVDTVLCRFNQPAARILGRVIYNRSSPPYDNCFRCLVSCGILIARITKCRKVGALFRPSYDNFHSVVLGLKTTSSANLWSPMLKDYSGPVISLTVRDLLRYTLTQSDNNASNLMFKGAEKRP